MMADKLDSIVEECLCFMATSSADIESSLRLYPEKAEELRPRLEAALWLRQVFQPPPPVNEDIHLNRLVLAVEERRNAADPLTHGSPARTTAGWWGKFAYALPIALLAIFVLTLAGILGAFSRNSSARTFQGTVTNILGSEIRVASANGEEVVVLGKDTVAEGWGGRDYMLTPGSVVEVKGSRNPDGSISARSVVVVSRFEVEKGEFELRGSLTNPPGPCIGPSLGSLRCLTINAGAGGQTVAFDPTRVEIKGNLQVNAFVKAKGVVEIRNSQTVLIAREFDVQVTPAATPRMPSLPRAGELRIEAEKGRFEIRGMVTGPVGLCTGPALAGLRCLSINGGAGDQVVAFDLARVELKGDLRVNAFVKAEGVVETQNDQIVFRATKLDATEDEKGRRGDRK